MSQSLVKNLIHLMYRTKHRQALMPPEEEHHRKITFQGELRGLLDRHQIKYDERNI